MKKPFLISGALILAILTIVGWSFELPLLEETVGVYDLLFNCALLGGGLGCLVGFVLAVKEETIIAKFQSFASSLLLFTVLVALLGHFSNRVFASESTSMAHLNVKQVTASWEGQTFSRQELHTPPDGYYIFVETDDGTVRLFQEGSVAPDIGPSRTVPVIKRDGYWGDPRYSISSEGK